jgi:hypothetical protein
MAAGNSGVFGDAARYTPAGAAFLNGALAHTLDFDDTHVARSLHPGASVISAARSIRQAGCITSEPSKQQMQAGVRRALVVQDWPDGHALDVVCLRWASKAMVPRGRLTNLLTSPILGGVWIGNDA